VKAATTFAAACALLIGAVAAHAAGDAAAGHALARHWCAGCHIVDDSGRGSDAAPTFAAIARRGARDTAWVRAWLAAPHPPMPNVDLTRPQTDDIVAYLESLAPR
jgi:mono/diheme cytochrome c family protein